MASVCTVLGACEPPAHASAAARSTLARRTRRDLEAIRLTELGARAGLVCELTGLERRVALRLYQEIHGRPSPAGQLPFSDTWYRRRPERWLHASIIWHLDRRLAGAPVSRAARLIAVYELYRESVAVPRLDIARADFVPRLVAMGEWTVARCRECAVAYVGPPEAGVPRCPACALYRRYRCAGCGAPLRRQDAGRRTPLCGTCRGRERGGR